MSETEENEIYGARKSREAFRTITEVADELRVPAHVLRFWESKFPQVAPVKRAGGRRYYRPDDVVLLKEIRDLLYRDGYTIKGVQKLIQTGMLRHISGQRDLAAPIEPVDNDDTTESLAEDFIPLNKSKIVVVSNNVHQFPVAVPTASDNSADVSELREELKNIRDILTKLGI